MNAKINTLVSTALNSVSAYGTAIAGLKVALKGQLSPKEVRAALVGPIASFYGVALVQKARGEGVTFDTAAAKFEAAKKALWRLSNDVAGKQVSNHVDMEVPADMLAVARKLVAMAAQYEHAGKLLAAALREAKE